MVGLMVGIFVGVILVLVILEWAMIAAFGRSQHYDLRNLPRTLREMAAHYEQKKILREWDHWIADTKLDCKFKS